MGTAVASIYPIKEDNPMIIDTPAKLNLTLEVLAERPDGFHEICSIIQTINLRDSLRFDLSQNINVKSNTPDWIPDKSLVPKAAKLLQKITGCSKGATIEVNKRIPLTAGLGGDSSDAAATLRGLNTLWELNLSLTELARLAIQLGSDVPFFLFGGTVLIEGRGELVTSLHPLTHMWVILLVPPVPKTFNKTKELYTSLKTTHYTNGQITKNFVDRLKTGREFIPSLLFNTFEGVSLTRSSELKTYYDQMKKSGATHVHLTGTGPSLYTLLRDKAQAEELHTSLKHQGLISHLTDISATLD
jgi:4-diphosphocytidyl-2-C-methyl-D-erythritol kinase